MAQLAPMLAAAHQPGPNMVAAAASLLEAEAQPGFGPLLLSLCQPGAAEMHLAQAAAIYFKNFLKRRWLVTGGLPGAEREALREALVPTAVAAPHGARASLCAGVEELSLSDFPERWPTLLPQLASALHAEDPRALCAGLEVTHAALAPLRGNSLHSDVVKNARFCAEALGGRHAEIWRAACQRFLSGRPAAGGAVAPGEEGLQLLVEAAHVLHDLTRAVMPEQMMANLDAYLQGFLSLLALPFDPAAAELPLQLCASLSAWIAHHKELLQPFASRIMEAIWNLLVALDDREENDPLVTSGLGVLSAVACQDWAPSPFEDPKVLAALCERLVLTNLSLRESDLRLFHEDLQEFIARDVEGSDRDTRRWAAVDLVRSLRRRHDKEICDVVVASAGRLLREAAVADERKVAIYKHACIHLVISMAGSSAGKTISTPGGIAGEYFRDQVAPEILSPGQPQTSEGILFKAACLKYVTVLRNILSVEMVRGILPVLPNLLQAQHPLLHTYAGICANVLTIVQDRSEGGPWKPRYDQPTLGPVLLQMMPQLLRLVVEGGSVAHNEHLPRALNAWMVFLGSSLPADLALAALRGLSALLASPSLRGADFIHSTFECLAQAMKAVFARGGEDAVAAETAVQSLALRLWESQAEELLPYCYQILGLLLELVPAERKPVFVELLPKVLAQELWQASGKVPGLVRLLRAYFANHVFFTALLMQAMPTVVERFRQALAQRRASAAVALFTAVVRFLPLELYQSHLQGLLSLCLARLEAKPAPELEKDLVVALSIFVYLREEPALLRQAMESLQPGLFEQFLMKVWLPGTGRVLTLQRRKICIFGLIRVMYFPEIQANQNLFEACCRSLLRLLRLRQHGLSVLMFEELFNGRPIFICRRSEEISPGDEYEAAYNQLSHAETKPDVWDVLPHIQDVATAKEAVKAALGPLQPALLRVENCTQALEEILQ